MKQFITTPSHGYLKMTTKEFLADEILLKWHEIRETFGYGYFDGAHVWLEEDCEAPLFCDLTGIDPRTIKETYSEAFDRKRENLGSIKTLVDVIDRQIVETLKRREATTV